MDRRNLVLQNITKTIFIVIPAFNEEKAIGGVIDEIMNRGYKNIIVVDDGSNDDTYIIAKSKRIHIIRHLINRGKGAATQTGLDAAKLLGADAIVTMDADGQHSSSYIDEAIKPILTGEVDVVLGSRLLASHQMPISRKIVNKMGNIITYILYGIYVSDSQSGFRVYSAKANQLIKTTFDRYEFESEVLQQIKLLKLKYKEIPIEIRYTNYSLNKWSHIKGIEKQNFMNSFNMLYRMIIRSLTT